jgi:hypothetical protein
LYYDASNGDAYLVIPETPASDADAIVKTGDASEALVVKYARAANDIQTVGFQRVASRFTAGVTPEDKRPPTFQTVGTGFTTPRGSIVRGISPSSVSVSYARRYPPRPPTPAPTATPMPSATPTPAPSATPVPSDTLVVVADTSNRSIMLSDSSLATGEFLTVQSANADAFFKGDSAKQTGTVLILADGGNQANPVGTVFVLPNDGAAYAKTGAISSGVSYAYSATGSLTLTGSATGKGLELVVPEPSGGTGAFVLRFEGVTNNGRNMFVSAETGTDSARVLFAASAANLAGATAQSVPFTAASGVKVTGVSTSTVSLQVPKS